MSKVLLVGVCMLHVNFQLICCLPYSSAVWYPPFDKASPENHTEFTTNYVQDEAHHMVVEIINDSLKAKEDCSTGLCVL